MKSDRQLQTDVLDELDWEPSIDAAQVGVTAKEGVITLTGHVDVFSHKLVAEEVARRVHGVKAVANDIDVRPAGSPEHDDPDLAAAALHVLQWDVRIPDERINITVRAGEVILEGQVEWQYQKDAADRAVRHLSGIRAVTNDLRVEPGDPTNELKASVEAALQRSAVLHARNIVVEIDDRTVILTGDVHSHRELDEAERTAWAARGVLRVANCLTITPWGTGPADEWGY